MAIPPCNATPVQIELPPLIMLTVPPAVPPPATARVAFRVTGWPACAALDVSAKVVAAFPTTMVTAAAVALYTTLGFIVTMSLMLFALIALEGRNLFAAAAYSVGVSLVTYGLFALVLKTPLEQGILGF